MYRSPSDCQKQLEEGYKSKWTQTIKTKAETDNDSRLGTYLRINPTLKSWVPKPQSILEIERKLVTRFRTGSHSLNIELGRYSNISRNNRLCKCKSDIQTVWHIFTACPLTNGVVKSNTYRSLSDIFSDDEIHVHILALTKVLKIPIGRM